jgi:predicted nucleic acid-binding protein
VAEAHSAQAHALLDVDHELIAPDIIQIETTNTLLKKVRRREMAADDARNAIAAFPGYLQIKPSLAVFDAAVELALSQGCTFYDALYVALAVDERCLLVTADRRLVNGLQRAFGPMLVWLGDLPIA